MSVAKRLRVIWAAVTQDWQQHTCECGATQWVEGQTWASPNQCVPCEAAFFEKWREDYDARWAARNNKGAA